MTQQAFCPFCHAEIDTTQKLHTTCPTCRKALRPESFSFFSCIAHALSQSFNFKGRATRAEFWYFFIFVNLIIILGTLFLCYGYTTFWLDTGFYALCVFLVMLPRSAAAVRRLHDIGKSGKLFLACMYPHLLIQPLLAYNLLPSPISTIADVLVTGLSLILLYYVILFFTDSQRGPNQYGPCTKYLDIAPFPRKIHEKKDKTVEQKQAEETPIK